MNLEKRISAFAKLGERLNTYLIIVKNNTIPESTEGEALLHLINTAYQHNGWFTKQNVLLALTAISEYLNTEALTRWTLPYNINTINSKKIGVIMAGNLPLVGFHDFLSVLISGHRFVGKLSSQDSKLLPFLAQMLISIEPEFGNNIEFSERVDTIDAAIATGSNNSSRYFEYYFGKYPHIIRKNRNSVAVFKGDETTEQFKALGTDIFQYFGLGCRNVSKLYVPMNYNFVPFFEALESFGDIYNHNKYANNYDYNRAIYLMSAEPIFDTSFLLLRECKELASPTAVLFYEYYDNIDSLKNTLEERSEEIQCVVSSVLPNSIGFGQTQNPQLNDYADGVDTMKFLLSL